MAYHIPAPAEFAALDFKAMVGDVAGRALLELVAGTRWNSIFHTVANDICAWRMSQRDVVDTFEYVSKHPHTKIHEVIKK